jgi:hypothetical protein
LGNPEESYILDLDYGCDNYQDAGQTDVGSQDIYIAAASSSPSEHDKGKKDNLNAISASIISEQEIRPYLCEQETIKRISKDSNH